MKLKPTITAGTKANQSRIWLEPWLQKFGENQGVQPGPKFYNSIKVYEI
jgi:hypothetical protein